MFGWWFALTVRERVALVVVLFSFVFGATRDVLDLVDETRLGDWRR